MGKVNIDNVELAGKLLKIRQERNLSQAEFAAKIGVTRQAVSRWEMGISIPSSKTLLRLCDEFNIPVEIIFQNKSIQDETIKKVEENFFTETKSIILICVSILGFILLPFLAEIKRAKEMELFKSAYEHAYYYILEFPLFIILAFSVILLIIGLCTLLKRRFFYEEKNH